MLRFISSYRTRPRARRDITVSMLSHPLVKIFNNFVLSSTVHRISAIAFLWDDACRPRTVMRSRFPYIAACLGVVVLLARPAWSEDPASPVAERIHATLEAATPAAPPGALEASLARFYEARNF